MDSFEQTFDRAAEAYERSRSLYVPVLYERILRYKPVDERSRVLEIGLGTGKATVPFLDTGYRRAGLDPHCAALVEEIEKLADLVPEFV